MITRSKINALTLGAALALSFASAHAAENSAGEILTLTTGNAESRMDVYWRGQWEFNGFGPITPCGLVDYTLVVAVDGAVKETYNRSRQMLVTENGRCVLRASIATPWGNFGKISPGLWSAHTITSRPLDEYTTVYACTPTQGKQPMYWSYHAGYTDNFYTASSSTHNAVLGIGYQNRGVAFSMPYHSTQGTKPFIRYFKGSPQLEHFYTHDANEARYVEQAGYVNEGAEGFIFDSDKPGAVALHRFVHFNPANGDLSHLYSIDRYEPQAAGMSYEAVVGYVCPP